MFKELIKQKPCLCARGRKTLNSVFHGVVPAGFTQILDYYIFKMWTKSGDR